MRRIRAEIHSHPARLRTHYVVVISWEPPGNLFNVSYSVRGAPAPPWSDFEGIYDNFIPSGGAGAPRTPERFWDVYNFSHPTLPIL